ncbi:MAG: hypothetical protein MPN21_14260 [Thermoanaerobaculia bacterium]|nr:hypothetical protein [Thermoanaerobaculia bacterium]
MRGAALRLAARRWQGAIDALHGPKLVLVALGLALLVLPLAIHKPGLPPTLKADEPAYFLAALSLVHDFDLRVDEADQRRVFETYPYLAANNFIVMTWDGWQTLYYGKPYLAPFLAAPFVAIFGVDGAVFFNMVLFLAMGAMGFDWLRRTNRDDVAAFFVVGFFLLSTAWSYVFWIHPEVLCMFGTCACLYFGFSAVDRLRSGDRSRGGPFTPGGQTPATEGSGALIPWLGAHKALALSAGCLALGVYNKPMLAAVGLPVLFELLVGRRWRGLVVWIAAAVSSMLVICGVAWAFTGAPTPYLVEHRAGFNMHNPTHPVMSPDIHEAMFGVRPDVAAEARKSSDAADRVGAGWWWLFRVPETKWAELKEDLVYFFIGRHTGLFLYMPFALLALLLFFVWGRDRRGWLVLGALTIVSAIFLIWIPFNWHGGGGFVGNRYFVMLYPAFLFLVRRIRPVASVAVFWALGGLLVGPLVLAPFGLVVPSPTLQAHARNAPLDAFPLEFSLRNLPGYNGTVTAETWLWGRKDALRVIERGEIDDIWLRGGGTVDVWLHRGKPLRRAVFELRAPIDGQGATIRLGDEIRTLTLGTEWTRLEFSSPAVHKKRRDRSPANYLEFIDIDVYRLRVQLERGRFPAWDGKAGPFFPRGAELRFFGEGAPTEPAADEASPVSQ